MKMNGLLQSKNEVRGQEEERGRACGATNVVLTIAEGVARNSPITPTVCSEEREREQQGWTGSLKA